MSGGHGSISTRGILDRRAQSRYKCPSGVMLIEILANVQQVGGSKNRKRDHRNKHSIGQELRLAMATAVSRRHISQGKSAYDRFLGVGVALDQSKPNAQWVSIYTISEEWKIDNQRFLCFLTQKLPQQQRWPLYLVLDISVVIF